MQWPAKRTKGKVKNNKQIIKPSQRLPFFFTSGRLVFPFLQPFCAFVYRIIIIKMVVIRCHVGGRRNKGSNSIFFAETDCIFLFFFLQQRQHHQIIVAYFVVFLLNRVVAFSDVLA